MDDLTAFGFYSETVPQLSRKLDSIKTATLLASAHPLKSKILHYLTTGNPHVSLFGRNIVDPFTSPPRLLGDTSNMLYDGVWMWPKPIIYFVDRYNLALPDDFMQHMESNQWQVPLIPAPKPKKSIGAQQYDLTRAKQRPPSKDLLSETLLTSNVELVRLFSLCQSVDDACDVCRLNTTAIVELLGIDSLEVPERLSLCNLLMGSIMPPKFIGQGGRAASTQEIAESGTMRFVFLAGHYDKLPISWDAKRVLWLRNTEQGWTPVVESWKEAMTRGMPRRG